MKKLISTVVCIGLLSSPAIKSMEMMEHHQTGAVAVSEFDRSDALAVSQSAIGRQLNNYHFQSSTGEFTSLKSLAGKPLIISLLYTSCHHICPATTQHLSKVVRAASNSLGSESFNVVSIGFDVHRDNPQMMQHFAEAQGVSADNWLFLSADENTVKALTKQLGFIYYPSASGFDHLVQATLVDNDLRVRQQTYGISFDMPLLIEPLKKLVLGQPTHSLLASVSNKVRLFCTVYDPAQDKYKFDYSLFIGMFIGFACVGLLGVALIREWSRTLASKSS